MPGLFLGLTDGLFGFPAQLNTMRAEKLHACRAFDTSNIWPTESASCVWYIQRSAFKG